VNWPLVAALAVLGLVTGWFLRAVIFWYAVPSGAPPGHACPQCGTPIRPIGRPPSAAVPGSGGAPSAARPGPGRVPSAGVPGPGGAPSAGMPGPGRAPSAGVPGPGGAPSAAVPRPGRRPRPFLARPGLPPWPALSPFGRCPACRARIGPAPLGVELVTAALFAGLAARVHPPGVLAAACWLAGCAVALAWIDAAVQRLPDALTAAAYAGTVGFLLLAAASSGHWGDLLRAVLGGLALTAAYLALAVISRSALGLGDVKLAASLGTLIAWPGWRTLVAGAFAGFLLGAVYGAGLLVFRRGHREQRIPFGPFMVAGAFLALLASAVPG
jgi:leader peptidase (prepilin peptidase) / N-methyltransferase